MLTSSEQPDALQLTYNPAVDAPAADKRRRNSFTDWSLLL